MVIGKEKFALWITPEAKKEVEAHYKQDNCKSQSEYIEKAVRFYSGYLETQHADAYLPRVLSEVLEGKLGAFGKRMGHLLFKLAVEMDMMMNILAAAMEIPEEQLRDLRGRCVQEVKKTHGMISLDDAVEYQNGGD